MRQAKALVGTNIDILAFETIPSLVEVKSILTVIETLIQSGSVPPVWISMACKVIVL